VAELDFAGPHPDAGELSQRWHAILDEARQVVDLLPPAAAGSCVLESSLALCRLGSSALEAALASGQLHFHPGRIGGALPTVGPPSGADDSPTDLHEGLSPSSLDFGWRRTLLTLHAFFARFTRALTSRSTARARCSPVPLTGARRPL
jgi:hypothetical protein